MNVGELLEELRENLLHDRSDQVAGASDYLWSDRTLVRYLNEAQSRFARGSLCLRDVIHDFPTRAFEKEYPLPEWVMAIISVRCHGDRADLVRAGHALFDTYHVPDTYFFDPSSLSSLPPGKMLSFDGDEYLTEGDSGSLECMTLRVYPAPDPVHVQPLHIRVVRLPKYRLICEDKDASPEIPEIHHLDMLDWAAYLALRIVDVDQGLPDRAQEFRASFEAHVKEARDIAMRKFFPVSAWGFGRNGFSWEIN